MHRRTNTYIYTYIYNLYIIAICDILSECYKKLFELQIIGFVLVSIQVYWWKIYEFINQ